VTKIVLSYRRDDTAGHVGRLTDRLCTRFGREAIFRDLDSIAPGRDFTLAIHEAIDACDAVVVVIGREWLVSARPDGQRRLDDPGDFVRVEITAALERPVQVIPVLVEGAQMPAPQDLPSALVPLAYRHALEISDSRWDYDVQRLIDVLDPLSPETLTEPVPVTPTRPRRRPLVLAAVASVVVATVAVAVLSFGGDDDPSLSAAGSATTTTAPDPATTTTATTTSAAVPATQPSQSIGQGPENVSPALPGPGDSAAPTPVDTSSPRSAPPAQAPAPAPAPAQPTADPVAGTWSGTVSDGGGGTFFISLDVQPGCALGQTCGSVYVSGNECLGDFIFYALSGGTYEFTVANFAPTSGPSCYPGPGEYLTPQGDGTLSYTTSYGPYGTLTRSS